MKKLRWFQAGLVLVLVLLMVLAWFHVRNTGGGEPLIRWIPASEAEALSRRGGEVAPVSPESKRAAAQEPVKEKSPECAPAGEGAAPAEEAAKEEEGPEIVWPPAGPGILEAVISPLAGELESFWGYRANDLVVGKILDDRTNQQRGEAEAMQSYVGFVADRSGPGNEAIVRVRAAIVDSDLSKWWFPSAESRLAEGLEAVGDMAAAMDRGEVVMPGDPATLADLLGLCASLLAAEEEVLTDSGSTLDGDDRFYHARGVAVVTGKVISGVFDSFPAVLENQGARTDLDSALNRLEQAANMDPLWVSSGGEDGSDPGHLVLLSYQLGQAGDFIRRAEKRMRTMEGGSPGKGR